MNWLHAFWASQAATVKSNDLAFGTFGLLARSLIFRSMHVWFAAYAMSCKGLDLVESADVLDTFCSGHIWSCVFRARVAMII